MKLRSLVLGAKIATAQLFNDVPLFQPRKQARIYWFGNKPERMMPNCDLRHVSINDFNLAQISAHMRSYCDIPSFFVCAEDATLPAGDLQVRLEELKTMLEGSAAYPYETFTTSNYDTIAKGMRERTIFDR